MRLFGISVMISACFALAGCSQSKPKLPAPDGSSGIVGVCLFPAEPAGANGKVPERQPWANIELHITHTNHSSSDPTWDVKYKTRTDANGRYKLALNPGDYLVYPRDPKLLKNVGVRGVHVKVEPGQFSELTIDYDQLQLSHPGKRP